MMQMKLWFVKEEHTVQWDKEGTTYKHENTILVVKYGGDSIMICSCFDGSVPAQIAIITIKSI